MVTSSWASRALIGMITVILLLLALGACVSIEPANRAPLKTAEFTYGSVDSFPGISAKVSYICQDGLIGHHLIPKRVEITNLQSGAIAVSPVSIGETTWSTVVLDSCGVGESDLKGLYFSLRVTRGSHSEYLDVYEELKCE